MDPLRVVTAPLGWDFVTDYANYVDSFSGDTSLPFPDDIAPGASLSGFSIFAPGDGSTTATYSLTTWDSSLGVSGAMSQGVGLGPGPTPKPSEMPESGTLSLASCFLLAAAGLRIAKKRKGYTS